MGVLCMRDHLMATEFWEEGRPIEHATLGEFVMCQVASRRWLFNLGLRLGFIDGDHEGALVYWRLDFWRSNYRRLLRAAPPRWETVELGPVEDSRWP